MTRLLVSVRSAEEALTALAGGADLLDIKEPSRGSLGAADSAVWREIAEVVNEKCPLSVACGELSDPPTAAIPCDHWQGISLAKIGPAGTANDWHGRWDRWREMLPASVEPVVVAYADWRAASSLSPTAILAHGAQAGCRWALIDTWRKDGRSLLDIVPPAAICEWLAHAAELNLFLVLAGSLRREEITTVSAWQPAAIAVRGAVCRGERTAAIDSKLVAELAALLKAEPAERGLRATTSGNRCQSPI